MKRLIISIFILGICISASSQVSNKNRVNTWGNTNSSLKQGGDVAYQDSVIYFSNPRDSFKLYRMKIDGSLKRRVSHDIPSQINVIGGYIYYINNNSKTGKPGMYRITTSGRDRIFYDINTSYLRVHNSGMAYFLLDGALYEINTNNISKPMELVFIEKDYITGAYITPDYVFYTKYWENLSVNGRSGGLYIYDRNTKKSLRLLNANHIISDFVVSDGWRWIFYTQDGGYYDNNSKTYPKGFYLVSDHDRDPRKMAVSEGASLFSSLLFIDKWLFYRSNTSGTQNRLLYRLSFDGKINQQLSSLQGKVYEAGEYLIFYDEKKIVRTLKDGRVETDL